MVNVLGERVGCHWQLAEAVRQFVARESDRIHGDYHGSRLLRYDADRCPAVQYSRIAGITASRPVNCRTASDKLPVAPLVVDCQNNTQSHLDETSRSSAPACPSAP